MKKLRYIAVLLSFSLLTGMTLYATDGVQGYPETPGGLQSPRPESPAPGETQIPRSESPAQTEPQMQDQTSPDLSGEQAIGAVNINTANADQLKMLPGIDDRLARNIVDYRDLNGPFSSPEDLLNVDGMTKEKLDKISANLVLEGDTTYQPGQSK
jgi:competence ComEA-like helix-hairpin-helix protein